MAGNEEAGPSKSQRAPKRKANDTTTTPGPAKKARKTTSGTKSKKSVVNVEGWPVYFQKVSTPSNMSNTAWSLKLS